VTFDLLEQFQEELAFATDWMYPEEDMDREVSQQFQNLGFEIHQPLENLGTLGLLCVAYCAKLILLGLSMIVKRQTGKGALVVSKLKS